MTASHSPRIDIAMATYNGGRYIRSQIESIFSQSHENWQLFIRDDGSTDDTVSIIKECAAANPERVTLLDDSKGNLGVVGNFSSLLDHSTADYVAFADQDDIWLPGKLEASLREMHRLEEIHGADAPLLVFGDLVVVDQALRPIAPSFWTYQAVDATTAQTFSRLLITNVVTGCTVLMNAALRRLVQPIPPEAVVHDWWIALCTAAFGHSAALSEPQILYRKHDNNATGPRRPLARIGDFLTRHQSSKKRLMKIFDQGAAFQHRFKNNLPPERVQELEMFLALPDTPAWQRFVTLRKGNFYGPHPVHLLGLAALTGRKVLF